MPNPSQPAPPGRRRFPIRADLDRRLDEAYLRGGYLAAMDLAEEELGWRPAESQLAIAIGRNAWILGEQRGDQGYQIRHSAQGIPMPMVDPDGRGSEAANPGLTEDSRYFPSIDRMFGIEIEFNRGNSGYNIQQRIVDAFNATTGHTAIIESYTHRLANGWRMRPDGTVTGGEFVSPILNGIAGHQEVREALKCVRDQGGVAGRSQGMHIHHDIRDHDASDMRRLVHNLRRAEEAILGYVPAYRWNEQARHHHRACRMTAGDWQRLEEDTRAGHLLPGAQRSQRRFYDRYVSFNFNATITYGSVEWRALGNTLNAIKIRTWIRVGQALIWYGKEGHQLPEVVNAAELMHELVRRRALPRREADRFLAEVSRREAAA